MKQLTKANSRRNRNVKYYSYRRSNTRRRRREYIPYDDGRGKLIAKLLLAAIPVIACICLWFYVKTQYTTTIEKVDEYVYAITISKNQPETIVTEDGSINTTNITTVDIGPLKVDEGSAIINPISPQLANTEIQVKQLRFDHYAYIQHLIETEIGNDTISIEYGDEFELVKCDLPNEYYGNIDFSSFQPIESYDSITNKTSQAYKISHSENAYTDEHGFRRYKIQGNDFCIDDQDDYIVAMGTFYKTKGIAGERFLIVTTTGSFTVITGDEKSNNHTDDMNMFTLHGNNGNKAGIIEYIVDTRKLDDDIASKGTATAGPVEAMNGEIRFIYKIEQKEDI